MTNVIAPLSPPPPLAVRLRRAALTMLALGAVAALLYARGIPCVFAHVFHTPCPGCGSTRACLALLHGDLAGVLRFNPLGPVAAALLAVLGVQALVSLLHHGDHRDVGAGRVGWIVKRVAGVIVLLEIGLWVARFFGAFGGPVPV